MSFKSNEHQDKYALGMSGEYFVTAELLRRGVRASITYGNAKSADVYAFSLDSDRYARIEVKTSQQGTQKWLTGKSALDPHQVKPNHYWVFVEMSADLGQHPMFYVLSAIEVHTAVFNAAKIYSDKHQAKHGKPYDRFEIVAIPADVVRSAGPGEWSKIINFLEHDADDQPNPLTPM